MKKTESKTRTPEDTKTYQDIVAAYDRGELVRHHTAYARGYYSRKADPFVLPYKGRFGVGYIVISATYTTTRYHWATYYVVK